MCLEIIINFSQRTQRSGDAAYASLPARSPGEREIMFSTQLNNKQHSKSY